jgi:hypothetical protein
MEEETFEKRANQAMDEEKVAQAGSFCWNEACADYGQVGVFVNVNGLILTLSELACFDKNSVFC